MHKKNAHKSKSVILKVGGSAHLDSKSICDSIFSA